MIETKVIVHCDGDGDGGANECSSIADASLRQRTPRDGAQKWLELPERWHILGERVCCPICCVKYPS